VETIEQLRLVRELGCDVVQGYLIATPMAPEKLIDWRREFRARWPAMITDEKLALWAEAK
jgi:EAL domain-containing protein (putative c-di-GMP-specific phosphodiesterase class I)